MCMGGMASSADVAPPRCMLRCLSCAEQEAISNMIAHFGSGVFATVMDSYDYQRVGVPISDCWVSGARKLDWFGVQYLMCTVCVFLCPAACRPNGGTPAWFSPGPGDAPIPCRLPQCALRQQMHSGGMHHGERSITLASPRLPACCQALDEVLPAVAAEKNDKGGFWVLRPDSGEAPRLTTGSATCTHLLCGAAAAVHVMLRPLLPLP